MRNTMDAAEHKPTIPSLNKAVQEELDLEVNLYI